MILPITKSLLILSVLGSLGLSQCKLNGVPEPSSVKTDSPGIPDNENSSEPKLDDPLFFVRDMCVTTINNLRESEGLSPLGRWQKGESCADSQAEKDFNTGEAHFGFEENNCGARAQNECAGWTFSNLEKSTSSCLNLMWDEKNTAPGERQHYISMSSENYREVACGYYVSGNHVWMVQNYR